MKFPNLYNNGSAKKNANVKKVCALRTSKYFNVNMDLIRTYAMNYHRETFESYPWDWEHGVAAQMRLDLSLSVFFLSPQKYIVYMYKQTVTYTTHITMSFKRNVTCHRR